MPRPYEKLSGKEINTVVRHIDNYPFCNEKNNRFKQEQKKAKLTNYLFNIHPDLLPTCLNKFFLTQLCRLFDTGFLSHTQTGPAKLYASLYLDLQKNILKHYIAKRDNIDADDVSVHTIFKDHKCIAKMCFTEHLAFQLTLKGEEQSKGKDSITYVNQYLQKNDQQMHHLPLITKTKEPIHYVFYDKWFQEIACARYFIACLGIFDNSSVYSNYASSKISHQWQETDGCKTAKAFVIKHKDNDKYKKIWGFIRIMLDSPIHGDHNALETFKAILKDASQQTVPDQFFAQTQKQGAATLTQSTASAMP